MASISIKAGLNLPFKNEANPLITRIIDSKTICIDLEPFTYLNLKLTKNLNETIKKGEILAKDTLDPTRVYLSHCSGEIVDIQRGEKRKITGVTIKLLDIEQMDQTGIDLTLSKERLMEEIFSKGLSFFIHKRPFHRVIERSDYPRSIFINTVNSAPYTPSYKHIFEPNSSSFSTGVSLLKKFAPVHIIFNEPCFKAFDGCIAHEVFGPHPIESPSLHIKAIDPITSLNDVIWSLDVYDVLQIGLMAAKGSVFSEKIITLCGEAIPETERTLIKCIKGANLFDLSNKTENLITGDPLTGSVNKQHMREKDTVVVGFVRKEDSEILSFLKPGWKKPTISKTYLGGFFRKFRKLQPSQKQGGEERPFIMKDLYQKHLPFHVYIEPLIKALLSKDFDLAIKLGFLDIDSKDLALSEYICPSKIPLMRLFEEGKKAYLLAIK
jgi:Na+-transporting NADH:ubiquinone oxidoreductase subunit A